MRGLAKDLHCRNEPWQHLARWSAQAYRAPWRDVAFVGIDFDKCPAALTHLHREGCGWKHSRRRTDHQHAVTTIRGLLALREDIGRDGLTKRDRINFDHAVTLRTCGG